MISYLDALAILSQTVTPLDAILVESAQALDRILAEDFVAPFGMPRFDNSSMDGFALRSEDTLNASDIKPLTLPVIRTQAAGDLAGMATSGQSVEIMTGAAMPFGMDSVIPIENVETFRDAFGNVTHICLNQPVKRHSNVRFAGEDFVDGQHLITAGTRLNATHIAMLFATGTMRVQVHEIPTVSIFTTGKEISDQYAEPLGPTQIYDSNTPYLIAELQTIGMVAIHAGHIGDDEQKFRDMLIAPSNSRILVSSGAVSKGKWDFIPSVLEEVGAKILFHRVSIKPGKPVLFAKLPDGRYFFGLPGNPISTAIGLRFFIMPLLRKLLGLPDERPCYGQMSGPYNKKGPLRLFLKSRVHLNQAGIMELEILSGQESFKIAPFLDTNAWAVFDERVAAYNKGHIVMYYPTRLLD